MKSAPKARHRWPVRESDESSASFALRVAIARAPRCADCGEIGERTGHMGCQYPQDRA